MAANKRIFASQKSHVTKISKTTFPKEFFNEIELKKIVNTITLLPNEILKILLRGDLWGKSIFLISQFFFDEKRRNEYIINYKNIWLEILRREKQNVGYHGIP